MEFKMGKWVRWGWFAVLTVIFFLGVLLLAVDTALFVSPDETAIALFARAFSQTGSFLVADPVSSALGDVLFPRSTLAYGGNLLPQTFLGFPFIVGSIMALLGEWVMPFVTGVVFLLAVIAWHEVVKKIFSQRIAFLTSSLLILHPVFWYYSARALMHNVFFVSMLMFATFFATVQPARRFTQANMLIAGVFTGLALFVRTSEVYWVGAVVLLLTVYLWKNIGWKQFLAFLGGGIIGLLPMFIMNAKTYGGLLTTGYTFHIPAPVEAVSTVVAEKTASALSFIFPFGFNEIVIFNNILNYGMLLFWWLGIPALIGVAMMFYRKHTKAQNAYMWTLVVVALWLFVWYGSWSILDNPDPTQVTIANSYVRYWMPISLLSLPLVAVVIEWIGKRFGARAAVIILFIMISLNIHHVLYDGPDALTSVVQRQQVSHLIQQDVLTQTEENAVIIVDRADKLFFPHRHVRYPLRDETTYELMPVIAASHPLYYYGITLPSKDLEHLNTVILPERDVQIEFIKTYQAESLYRIFEP